MELTYMDTKRRERMRFSEAMMLGSKVIKPLAYSKGDDQGSGCVLGMAEFAVGRTNWGGYFDEKAAENVWPWLTEAISVTPCGCHYYKQCGTSIFQITAKISTIVHLFNEHVMQRQDWTMERLADWIRSVEPEEPRT